MFDSNPQTYGVNISIFIFPTTLLQVIVAAFQYFVHLEPAPVGPRPATAGVHAMSNQWRSIALQIYGKHTNQNRQNNAGIANASEGIMMGGLAKISALR